MRDRLISVAISREPEPPAFRVHDAPRSLENGPSRTDGKPRAVARAEPASREAWRTSDETTNDVRAVKGIGPVFAGRLAEAGITNVAQLASARPERVAAAAEVALSRAAGWVEAARRMG